jgi:hypothetical protein
MQVLSIGGFLTIVKDQGAYMAKKKEQKLPKAAFPPSPLALNITPSRQRRRRAIVLLSGFQISWNFVRL